MRKLCLFIAMSLDGYIADSKGQVGWLNGQDSAPETIDPYSAFVKNIDTVFMGWNTYHQIVTELSPKTWIYHDFTTYVFTHKTHPSSEKIRFVNTSPADLLQQLKAEQGKDIWLCGGADLVRQLLRADLIDVYYITVIPILLGSGIRLFDHADQALPLRLVHTQSYNGMTDLVYTRRQ